MAQQSAVRCGAVSCLALRRGVVRRSAVRCGVTLDRAVPFRSVPFHGMPSLRPRRTARNAPRRAARITKLLSVPRRLMLCASDVTTRLEMNAEEWNRMEHRIDFDVGSTC